MNKFNVGDVVKVNDYSSLVPICVAVVNYYETAKETWSYEIMLSNGRCRLRREEDIKSADTYEQHQFLLMRSGNGL